ncbi:MAG: DUF2273 domain-containing protein [Selenomonadaceae bacterium]|nr:DUF2273 domain-containing protein [Selenomonadaceae bacterium]
MQEELKELIVNILRRHRGKAFGTLLGLFVGLCVLVFGFFQTAFVALCGLFGLFIGVKLDDEEDFWASLQKYLPERFQRW